MFIIRDELATHGLGGDPNLGEIQGFHVVDVRDINDGDNPIEVYKNKLNECIYALQQYGKIVVCCGAGVSRSNSIALAVLIEYFKMSFDDACDLIREKVPIAHPAQEHIDRLKELFGIKELGGYF